MSSRSYVISSKHATAHLKYFFCFGWSIFNDSSPQLQN